MQCPPENRALAARISCLMVTQPSAERWDLFRRSVACFLAQTYRERELVVVLDQGPAEYVSRIREHLAGLPGVAAVVQPRSRLTLGALRNVSVEAASGSMLCQWDDDDLSHPDRLAEQYRLLRSEGAIGVGLQEIMHFFPRQREIYWTNFRAAPRRCAAGTLMFRRDVDTRYPDEGPDSRFGEDAAMVRGLEREGKLVHLAAAPHLYIYVCHDCNISGRQLHRTIARSLGLSRGLLLRRREAFEQLGCFDLGEGPLDVVGSNGPAFQIFGRNSSPASARKGIAE